MVPEKVLEGLAEGKSFAPSAIIGHSAGDDDPEAVVMGNCVWGQAPALDALWSGKISVKLTREALSIQT